MHAALETHHLSPPRAGAAAPPPARAPPRRRGAAPPPRLRLAEYGCDLTAVPLENASAEYFISK